MLSIFCVIVTQNIYILSDCHSKDIHFEWLSLKRHTLWVTVTRNTYILVTVAQKTYILSDCHSKDMHFEWLSLKRHTFLWLSLKIILCQMAPRHILNNFNGKMRYNSHKNINNKNNYPKNIQKIYHNITLILCMSVKRHTFLWLSLKIHAFWVTVTKKICLLSDCQLKDIYFE